MSQAMQTRLEKIVNMGKWRYTFIDGGLKFGVLTAVIFILLTKFTNEMTTKDMILPLIIFPLVMSVSHFIKWHFFRKKLLEIRSQSSK
ncbi:MAG: hypothetical protein ACTMIA_13805 [Vibrio sp.]